MREGWLRQGDKPSRGYDWPRQRCCCLEIDLFFDSADNFAKYSMSESLSPELLERLYGTDPALVKRIEVPSLQVLKISYPRPHPQGWMGERDMHQGQSFARLLEVDVSPR